LSTSRRSVGALTSAEDTSDAAADAYQLAGIRAQRAGAAYEASKAACAHLSTSTAVEYASSGIRVNCVAPGLTITGKCCSQATGRMLTSRVRYDSQHRPPGICSPKMAGQDSSWPMGHSGGGCIFLSVSLREFRSLLTGGWGLTGHRATRRRSSPGLSWHMTEDGALPEAGHINTMRLIQVHGRTNRNSIACIAYTA
jgi:hypothetical protein